MPYEFEDLSKQVADNTADVKKGLDSVVVAAEKVDKQFQKLTKTQKESLKISDKFNKALEKTRKGVLAVGKAEEKFLKGLKSVNTATRSVTTGLGGMVSGIAATSSVLKNASSNTIAFGTGLIVVEKSLGNMTKASTEVSKNVKKGFGGDIPDNMGKSKRATKELKESFDDLDDGMQKASKTIGDVLSKRMAEGRREAKGFADGLGANSKGMMAAGVAAYFLFQKVGDLTKNFQRAANDLSKFKVQTAAIGKTIMGATGPSLDNMRRSLKLTREQSAAFFDVVKDGANSLGLTQGKMMAVSKQLQETFGGDPTKRLQEYIDLLKEIPTLDTDLKIGASMDDQSAAIFALAEKGKIDVVMDLQTAGLAGGAEGEPLDGAKMLNAQQKTEYTTEKIGDFLVGKMYPEWGNYLSAAAEGTAKVFEGIGGLMAVTGAMQFYLGGLQTAQTAAIVTGDAAIITAINGQTAASLLGNKGRIFKKVGGKMPGMGRVAQRTALKFGGKSAATNVAAFSKSLTTAGSKLLSLGKAFNIAAIATVAVGLGAKYLEKKFEESGNKLAQAAAKETAALSEVAGAILLGAAIGSVVPVIGTAVGAVAGALIGVTMNLGEFADAWVMGGREFQSTIKDFDGKPVQKYNAVFVTVGKIFERVGTNVQNSIKGIKDAFEFLVTGTVSGGNAAIEWASSVGISSKMMRDGAAMVVGSFLPVAGAAITVSNHLEDLQWLVSSKTQIKQQKALTIESKKLDKEFQRLRTSETDAAKELEGFRKAAMESGLSLQRAMMGVRQAVNDAKLGLYDFRKEVAMIDVSTISELGGSAAVFMGALGDASAAATDKFNAVQKNLSGMEREIMNDQKMLPQERRSALDAMHKEEMIAAKDFADAIGKVIDAIYETPLMKKAGIKRETAATEMETKASAGALSKKDFDKLFEDMGDSIDTQMEEYRKASVAAAAETEKLIKKETDDKAKGQEKLLELYKQADDAEKKRLSGAVDVSGGDAKLKSEEDIQAAYAKTKDEVKGLTDEAENLRKKLPTFFTDTAAGLATMEKDTKILTTQRDESKVKRMKKGTFGGTKVEGKEAMDMAAAEKKLDEQIKGIQEDSNKEKKKMVVSLMEQVPSIKSEAEANAVISILTAEALSGAKMSNNELQALKDSLGMNAEEWGVVKSSLEKINNFDKGVNKAVEAQVAAKDKELKQAAGREKAMRDALGPVDNGIVIGEAELKKQQLFAQIMRDRADQLSKLGSVSITEIDDAKNELAAKKKKTAIAMQVGGIVAAVVDEEKATNAVLNEELKAYSDNRVIAAKITKDSETELAAKRKELEAKKAEAEAQKGTPKGKAAAGAVKQLEDDVGRLEVMAKQAAKQVGDMDTKLEEINSRIPAVGSTMDKMLSKVENSTEMASARLSSSLGDAMYVAASYAEDAGKSAEEAFKLVKKGAEEEAKLLDATVAASMAPERAAFEARKAAAYIEGKPMSEEDIQAEEDTLKAKEKLKYAEAENNLKGRVVEAAKQSAQIATDNLDLEKERLDTQTSISEAFDGSAETMKPLYAKSVEVEKKRLIIMKKQAVETADGLRKKQLEVEITKKEAEIRKTEYENTKKVSELQKDRISLEESVLQDQLSYLEEIGGSWSAIVGANQQIVGLAKENLDVEKQRLADAIAQGASGLDLQKQQAAVQMAQTALQRKALGVQKGIIEKILGAAFGGLSNIGARKGFTSQQAMLGVNRTRIYTDAGVPIKGKPMTKEQKEFSNQMSSGTRMFGTGKMAEAAMGGGVKRLPTEEAMEKGLRTSGVAESTKKTEASSRKLTGRATTGHSIYTADFESQNYLASILYVLKEMAVAVISGPSSIVGGAKKNSDDVKAGFEKGLADVKKATEEAQAGIEKGNASRDGSDTADATEEVSETLDKSLEVSKKEFRKQLEQLKEAKKQSKDTKKMEQSAYNQAKKVTALERQIRGREAGNMMASPLYTGEDRNQIMTGEVDPQIKEFASVMEEASSETQKSAKATADSTVVESKAQDEKQTKQEEMIRSEGKFKMRELRREVDKRNATTDKEAEKMKASMSENQGDVGMDVTTEDVDKFRSDEAAKVAQYQKEEAAKIGAEEEKAVAALTTTKQKEIVATKAVVAQDKKKTKEVKDGTAQEKKSVAAVKTGTMSKKPIDANAEMNNRAADFRSRHAIAGMGGGGKAIPLGSKPGIKGMSMDADLAERHANSFYTKRDPAEMNNRAADFRSRHAIAGMSGGGKAIPLGSNMAETNPRAGRGTGGTAPAAQGPTKVITEVKLSLDTKLFKATCNTMQEEHAKTPQMVKAINDNLHPVTTA